MKERKKEREWNGRRSHTTNMSYVLILCGGLLLEFFHFYSSVLSPYLFFPFFLFWLFCCNFAPFVVSLFISCSLTLLSMDSRNIRCCKRIVCLQYRYHLRSERLRVEVPMQHSALVYSGMLSIFGIGKVSWLSLLSNGIYLRLKFFPPHNSLALLPRFLILLFILPNINFCILYASRSILVIFLSGWFLLLVLLPLVLCWCCFLFVHSIEWCIYRLSATFSIPILPTECIYCVRKLFHLRMRLMKSSSAPRRTNNIYIYIHLSPIGG